MHYGNLQRLLFCEKRNNNIPNVLFYPVKISKISDLFYEVLKFINTTPELASISWLTQIYIYI